MLKCCQETSFQGFVNMHEFSIVVDLLKSLGEIKNQEGLKKIDKVNLQIGEMMQVVPETFIFAFKSASLGTEFCDTEINIEIIKIRLKCNNCGELYDYKNERCPKCSANDFVIEQGKEFVIKSIEGE